MDFFTHIIVSVSVARLLFKDEHNQRAFIIGGMAPDFDVFVAWIPFFIPEFFFLSHRGIFHSFLFIPLIVTFLIFLTHSGDRINRFKHLKLFLQDSYTEFNVYTVVCGFVGSCLHFLMDIVTHGGLPIFLPFSSQRLSTSTLSYFDPIVTLLSIISVIWFVLKRFKGHKISLIRIDKITRIISLLFLIFLILYGFIQVNTIQTHNPDSSIPGFIPLYRWIIEEQEDNFTVHLVNQLTQKILKTYTYTSIVWNKTNWNRSTIDFVIELAEKTIEFKAFIFNLGPEKRLVYNISFNSIENLWEVRLLDIFRDAQFKYYRISSLPFDRPEKVINVKI
ncbi:MAG: metal-dependent hydrolase [Candidatus Hodarchaeales archaeon]|jgi:inner membrane protein